MAIVGKELLLLKESLKAEALSYADRLIEAGEAERWQRQSLAYSYKQRAAGYEKVQAFADAIREAEAQAEREKLGISQRLKKDYLQPKLAYHRWRVQAVLSIGGELYSAESLCESDWGRSEWPYEEAYGAWFMGAAVQSYFASVGSLSGFDESKGGNWLEELATDWQSTLIEVFGDYQSYEDDEEFIENYDEEALPLMKAIEASGGSTEYWGFEWRHTIKDNELIIELVIGDLSASLGEQHHQKELAGLDTAYLDWSDCEDLDRRGDSYDTDWQENVCGEELVYGLGLYLSEELMKPYKDSEAESLYYYDSNKAEALVAYLFQFKHLYQDLVEELIWADKEGIEVLKLWFDELERLEA